MFVGPAVKAEDVDWHWSVLSSSKLMIKGSMAGDTIIGSFPNFSGDIYFNPYDMSANKVAFAIDTRLIKLPLYNQMSVATSPDWLDAFRFPRAEYTATEFVDEGNNVYLAKGYLKIKEAVLPLPLRFKLDLSNVEVPENQTHNTIIAKRATVKGVAVIDRSFFGIGLNAKKEASQVDNLVYVYVILNAE